MADIVDPADGLLRELDARLGDLHHQLDKATDRAARRRIRKQIRVLLVGSVHGADKVRASHGTEQPPA